MNRSEYLEKVWKRYPAMPAGAIVAGRIYNLVREVGALELTLQRDSLTHKVKFDKAPEFSEFLDFGDIVDGAAFVLARGKNLATVKARIVL